MKPDILFLLKINSDFKLEKKLEHFNLKYAMRNNKKNIY